MNGTKVLWGQILLIAALALGGVWAATQWVAWQLAYQSGLGPPWFRLGVWPVYPPPAFFFWWFVYDAYAPSVFVRGAFIAASGAMICQTARNRDPLSAPNRDPLSEFERRCA
uniref:Type IV secretory pathway VirD4 protein-like protein n=1 Tax=Caulobacter sp. (strain K31) TaxID=366602 RepID=B0T8N7_CAUSK